MTELARTGRGLPWLSSRSNIPARDLEQKLELQRDFTVTDLAAIATALDVEVVRLLPSAAPP